MPARRVMVLCLDAFDAPLGNKLIEEGMMPGLERLKQQSARYDLEHGPGGKSRYTGLTWEHFSSGCKPETTGRWSVITWNPETYEARQLNVVEPPFLADLEVKCAVFDPPYWNLDAQNNAVGVVGWSGHDTGCDPASVPDTLMAEIIDRFGAPPNPNDLNTMVYSSNEKTRSMSAMIIRALKQRGDIAEWLFSQRCTDWDVAILGFAETHDAIELFTHGVVEEHMLADSPTSEAARESIIACYQELDRQISRLMDTFPDVTFVAFTMHGMGYNDTDLPTMLLLPELMYRMRYEQPLFRSRSDWKAADIPVLRSGEDWNEAVTGAMRHPSRGVIRDISRRATGKAQRVLKKVLGSGFSRQSRAEGGLWQKSYSVNWMPSAHYSRYWPEMPAIGVPAYFDGRVRVNLEGREKTGIVKIEDYRSTLDHIAGVLNECVDVRTGHPVVREMEMPGLDDPLGLEDTQADIKILWNESPVGFRHPRYGDIGPAPIRRVGGHSGGYGALYISGEGIEPGDYGLRSSFDVAPTIIDLLGAVRPNRMDGKSVLENSMQADGLVKAQI